MKLSGKVAMVTGSGYGIGRATALAMAQEGADLVINDIVPERVERVVGEGSGAGIVPAEMARALPPAR